MLAVSLERQAREANRDLQLRRVLSRGTQGYETGLAGVQTLTLGTSVRLCSTNKEIQYVEKYRAV